MLLLTDNHNSVNGIKEYCANKNGFFEYCPIQRENLRIGLVYIESIGIERINERISGLIQYLITEIKEIKHTSAKIMAIIMI